MTKVKQILDEMKLVFTEYEDQIHLNIEKTIEAMPILEKCKDHLSGFEVISGTMDDAFIAITGKEIRE